MILGGAVEEHGGRVVKHLGDGILATFGGAAEGVAAAGAIQAGVERLNRRVEPAQRLLVRVGLSAGDVSWDEGDCHGTPVVTASRLCDAAEGGEILCDDLVRGLARGRTDVRFRLVGERGAKGLSEPVVVHEVPWRGAGGREAAPLPGALRVGASELPFAGREVERAALAGAWKRVQAEGAGVVLVSGEPGIGKTRLAAELARAAHGDGGLVLVGRCDEHVAAPYAPWVEALRHLVGHVDETVLAGNVARHGGELGRLVPEALRRVEGAPAPVEADPESERLWLFDAVVDVLATAAEETPVLLVLDDAQWADSASVALLRHLVRHVSPDAALLVVVTYRDTDVDRTHALAPALAELRRAPNVTRVVLRGLDELELRALLEGASGHELPPAGPALVRRLFDETEGNPFFVSEVLFHLVESGALVQRDGRWVGTVAWDEVGLPEGVRDVVGRRLSILDETANEVLRVAAVLGREFDTDVVAAVADQPVDAVVDDLDAVLAAALVAEVDARAGRLSFTHALVRQTLLDELSTNRRVRLHRRAAEVLEGRVGVPVELLAHHYLEAASLGVADRAVRYATEAAAAAHRQAAFSDEVALLARALEACDLDVDPDPGLRSELLATLATAEHFNANPDRGRALALDAADAARRAGSARLLAQAGVAYQGYVTQWARPADPVASDLMREGLAGLRDADATLRARVTASLAFALVVAPGDEAYQTAIEAVRLARSAGDDAALLGALESLAWTERGSVSLSAREATVAEFVALAERHADRRVIAGSQFYLGRTRVAGGDLDGADAAFEASCSVRGMSLEGWTIRAYRAARLGAEGRYDESAALTDEAHELGIDAGATNDGIWHAQHLHAAWDRGDFATCRARAAGLAEDIVGVLAPFDALVAWVAGDTDQARAAFAVWFDQVRPHLPVALRYSGAGYASSLVDLLGDARRAEPCLGDLEHLSGELLANEVSIGDAVDTAIARLMAALGRLDDAITLGEAGDALHRRLGLHARTAQSCHRARRTAASTRPTRGPGPRRGAAP